MNWKILLMLLLSFMLVVSLFAGCAQLQQEGEILADIRQQVQALPTVEEFKAMDPDAQQAAYQATQEAYDAYMKLSEDLQKQLKKELGVIETLFAYFNSQIMPIAE